MGIHEIPFPSTNGRDEIQAWLYTPAGEIRGVVQLVHGLGEHSRRYLHLISTLLDNGFAVAADDHAGHGRTATLSGVWRDAGEHGNDVVVKDEKLLLDRVREILPGLPVVMFGHSWGSMIARVFAARYPDELAGLAVSGVAAQMKGMANPQLPQILDDAIAQYGAQTPDTMGASAGIYEGFLERFGEDEGASAWISTSAAVAGDHDDPFLGYGTPLTLRFARSFVDIYNEANGAEWAARLNKTLPVLIMAGDQDPVANFGEGAYHVANTLWDAGVTDVRTRVFPGMRHEVHNEPEARAAVEAEIVAFAERCVGLVNDKANQ